jgi:acetyl esterase
MSLNPAPLELLGKLIEAGAKPFHQLDLPVARQAMSGLFNMMGPGPSPVATSDHQIPIDGDLINARLYTPSGQLDALMVYYHGGGWVLGQIADYDGFARTLAVGANCAVLTIDYRLAPEHPFPQPVIDAFEALKWATANRSVFGLSDVPVLVAGDSAGGNLAAVVARRARDQGINTIAGQILICPVVQSDEIFPSQSDENCQILIGIEDIRWFWNHYVPDTKLRSHCDVSPLMEQNLGDLPPAMVITAEFDVSRDEGEEYAKRLEAAGIRVVQRRFDGEFHAFAVLIELPSSSACVREIRYFIETTL